LTDGIEDFATGGYVQILPRNKPVSDTAAEDGKQPHGQIRKG